MRNEQVFAVALCPGYVGMILAVDCREFTPGRMTGIGRFLRILLEEVAQHRPHLRTVAVVGPGAAPPVAAPHVTIQRLPGRPTLYVDQVLLPRILRQVRATVFFSPYYKAPLRAPCPTMVTVHDLIPLTFPEYTPRMGSGVRPCLPRMGDTLGPPGGHRDHRL